MILRTWKNSQNLTEFSNEVMGGLVGINTMLLVQSVHESVGCTDLSLVDGQVRFFFVIRPLNYQYCSLLPCVGVWECGVGSWAPTPFTRMQELIYLIPMGNALHKVQQRRYYIPMIAINKNFLHFQVSLRGDSLFLLRSSDNIEMFAATYRPKVLERDLKIGFVRV